MASLRYSVGILSLLSGVAHAAPCNSSIPRNSSSSTTTTSSPGKMSLVPVANSNRFYTAGRNITPQKNLNLSWQTPNNDSIVSLGMEMQNTAVALEDVEDVTAVDCSGNASVAITFSNTEAFNEAFASWGSLNDSFVLITNHLGDCDAELERSFFVADSDNLASYETNLTIVVPAEKSDIVNTASSTAIDFNSVVSANPVQKRGIDWNEDTLTIAYNYSIPSDQTIVDTDYLTVKINEAYVNNSVSYSGHAKWELWKGVTAFYIDIDKSINHYADMEIDVKVPVSKSWTWSPAALSYAVLDIPGIISLGPSAGISFGGSVTAALEGSINGNFTSAMPNGTIHMDFVNWDSSYSSGWETDYNANFNSTEDVAITLKPYIDFTVEFAAKLFGGIIDLSTGVKAEPSFPFVTTAAVTQTVNTTSGSVTYPNSTSTSSCANGLSEDIDFQFDIIAFATQWVDITLYEYKADIWDGCLDWFTRRH